MQGKIGRYPICTSFGTLDHSIPLHPFKVGRHVQHLRSMRSVVEVPVQFGTNMHACMCVCVCVYVCVCIYIDESSFKRVKLIEWLRQLVDHRSHPDRLNPTHIDRMSLRLVGPRSWRTGRPADDSCRSTTYAKHDVRFESSKFAMHAVVNVVQSSAGCRSAGWPGGWPAATVAVDESEIWCTRWTLWRDCILAARHDVSNNCLLSVADNFALSPSYIYIYIYIWYDRHRCCLHPTWLLQLCVVSVKFASIIFRSRTPVGDKRKTTNSLRQSLNWFARTSSVSESEWRWVGRRVGENIVSRECAIVRRDTGTEQNTCTVMIEAVRCHT